METLVISDKKIKIILSSEDMKRYELSIDNIGITESFTRNALRQILSKAGEEAGINIGSKKIMIEAFPCIDGGCELFVNLQDENDNITTGILPIKPRRACLRAVYESNDKFESSLEVLKGNVNITKKEATRDRYTDYIILDIYIGRGSENMGELFSALLLSFGASKVILGDTTRLSDERIEKIEI